MALPDELIAILGPEARAGESIREVLTRVLAERSAAAQLVASCGLGFEMGSPAAFEAHVAVDGEQIELAPISAALAAEDNVIPPDAPRSVLICDGVQPSEVPTGACSGKRWTRGQLLAIAEHGSVMARIDRSDYHPATGAVEATSPSPADLAAWGARFQDAGVEIVHVSLPLFLALVSAAGGKSLEQASVNGVAEK